MSTHDYVIANASGSSVRSDLNNALAAIVSNNSSSSEPSTKYSYMLWADTTNGILKIRNSANNAWVELLQLDGTLTMEDGAEATPGLAFRDDLNTGIWSSAADTFNISTGGTERLELGAATVFNESGADVDFRIEGDSDANLFYVDAGNDRIGLGIASPTEKLHVIGQVGGSNPTAGSKWDIARFVAHDYSATNSGGLTIGAYWNSTTVSGRKAYIQSSQNTNSGSTVRELALNPDGGDVSIGDGNLVVANTHGIDFSASEGGHSTSNEASILDDYETGTFTPGITFGNSSTGISLGTALGSYTKIGRRVFIDFTINMSAKGTDSTGQARISGLPFTCKNETVMRVHGFFSYYANMQSLTGRPVCYNAANATTAALYDDAASTQPSMNDTNFANNSSIRGKIEYTCA